MDQTSTWNIIEADLERTTETLDEIIHFCKAAVLECHADMLLGQVFNS